MMPIFFVLDKKKGAYLIHLKKKESLLGTIQIIHLFYQEKNNASSQTEAYDLKSCLSYIKIKI